MRSSRVVHHTKYCWKLKAINVTVETTNNTMIWALSHGYKALPKLIAITRHRILAVERIAPIKSKFLVLSLNLTDFGRGSHGGRIKR